MKKLVIILLLHIALVAKADSPKVYLVEIFHDLFTNRYPLNQPTKEIIRDTQYFTKVSVQNPSFLDSIQKIAYSLPESEKIFNDSAFVISARLVCLIRQNNQIDTLSFGTSLKFDGKRIMEFNGQSYYQNDTLVRAVMAYLPPQMKRETEIFVLGIGSLQEYFEEE